MDSAHGACVPGAGAGVLDAVRGGRAVPVVARAVALAIKRRRRRCWLAVRPRAWTGDRREEAPVRV
jgi:hypothetical protein